MLSFDIHSPEQEIHSTKYLAKGVRVFVKRDDLIHPFISGNKWRKLKYHLIEAKRLEKKKLCTFGGAWSNHLLATACAGALFGFKTKAFVRGEQVNNPVLSLCQVYGMELEFVSRESYRNKEELKSIVKDKDTFIIEEGGFGPLALNGCEELIYELANKYNHLFVASGTGTTTAGLQKGLNNSNLTTTLHTVPVLKNGEFIRTEIESLGVSSQQIEFHTDYHFGGYAKSKPELLEFIKTFVAQTGILIEPTYTGKLFYAVDDLIQKDYFRPNDKILILHTGGLTGFLGMYERFTF
ncbi:1-aminocyclopropane-1-carboxylate deaminase [Sphingobacterium sp. KB22]|uniref:1-aminocyclopropane-1-carboxylate deaminase n=2 Tax=Sphingobacterium hungaricum TaxID=2082723 RepID=A0A928V1H0_9SPHI|nr:pyridoxal-phosphate dependent enzyme [Sphingobacterium hungaricum]MBE8714924.1 1-aminocyclopropane-1-carboxylate deaminase [Sphingobacterium hungaricum]